MNYDNYFRDKSFIERKIIEKKAMLESAKETNNAIEQVSAHEMELRETYDELHSFIAMLTDLRNKVSSEDTDFRTRRVDYLNQIITETMATFFPEKGLQAKIEYNDKRNNTKAALRIIDSKGHKRKPSISEGKLCQYLISFSAVAGVLKSLNKNAIYIDEAFGVAARERLSDIGEMLDAGVKNGIFILAVTQNPELYDSIPRREIRLQKEITDDLAYVQEVLDY